MAFFMASSLFCLNIVRLNQATKPVCGAANSACTTGLSQLVSFVTRSINILIGEFCGSPKISTIRASLLKSVPFA